MLSQFCPALASSQCFKSLAYAIFACLWWWYMNDDVFLLHWSVAVRVILAKSWFVLSLYDKERKLRSRYKGLSSLLCPPVDLQFCQCQRKMVLYVCVDFVHSTRLQSRSHILCQGLWRDGLTASSKVLFQVGTQIWVSSGEDQGRGHLEDCF